MIEAQISNQKLNITQPFVVADTIDYLEMKFTFLTKDWDNAIKWAHFVNKDKNYLIKLVDDNITKKMHLNLSKGDWTVWVHGNIGDERITTNRMNLKVLPTGDMNGEPLPITPPSAGEQIQKTANEAKEIAQSVRDDADAGKFNGEKGEKGDRGDSGVYVGADPVPEGTKVQVDPTAKSKAIIVPEKTSELENDSDFATNKSVDDKIANIPSGDSGISRLVIVPNALLQEVLGWGTVAKADGTLAIQSILLIYDADTLKPMYSGFPNIIHDIVMEINKFEKPFLTKAVLALVLPNGDVFNIDFDEFALNSNGYVIRNNISILANVININVELKFETEAVANEMKVNLDDSISQGATLGIIFQEIKDTVISEAIV